MFAILYYLLLAT